MNKLYNYFENLYSENKISQAFLIGNVVFDDVKDDLERILKNFIFQNDFDLFNNPDVKIFLDNDDSQKLNKDSTTELINYLSTTSQFSNKKVYIIENCENLNTKVSNALLKTIEEPAPGVYAILLTRNINSVIKTISSRCQKVFVSSSSNLDISSELVEVGDKLMVSIEKDGLLVLTDNDFYKKIKTRDDLNLILKYLINRYNTRLHELVEKNDNNDELLIVSKKLLIINKYIDKLNYNLNKNLTFDNFIIEMWRCK